MEQLLKMGAAITSLVGVGSLVISMVIWRFLIPQTSVKTLRGEMDYYLKQIEVKDKQLLEFRGLREGDIARLALDEERVERLKERLEELAAWRYGANRYMRALEGTLKRQGLQVPDRADYGIDGEDED